MSSDEAVALIKSLLGMPALDLAAFEDTLGLSLTKVDENPSWAFYKFTPEDESFERGDIRIAKNKPAALVSLWTKEGEEPKQDDFTLTEWGEPVDIDINPDLGPEGTFAYVYQAGEARLSFQFTYSSRLLRSVAVEWKPTP
jgi:hypothetical protein